jgi:serine/threonine protein kinase/Tol biopolymer transport system component
MDRLGPYELRGALGHGGGGKVFRAWDPRLEREVALKILHERFESDPERVRLFVAEGRAASALNHPNIVTIFDAAIDGGTPYIVSEMIDGRSLREELVRGPLPLKRVLDVPTQIADGLSAAHEAGIKHGDLKPENIMLTRAGRAKIVDFGLTRAAGFSSVGTDWAAQAAQTQTVAGLVAGTVPYMSPEQARGLPTDTRSDQFAFGLVVFEMVTGRRGFMRDTPAATLEAIIHEDPPALSARDGRVPPPLSWIVDRCLAKDPADRYGSTADLHRDLKTLRDRLGDIAPPSPSGRRAARTGRVLALVTGAVLFAIVGASLATFVRGPAPPEFSRLSFMPWLTRPVYVGQPAWSPNEQAIAFVSEVGSTLQIFAQKIGSSDPVQLTHQMFDCTHPFWSADGRRVYFISRAQQSEGIWSVAYSAAGERATPLVVNASRGAWSPDGKTLAFLRNDTDAGVIGAASLWVSTPGGVGPWTMDGVEAAAKKRTSFGGKPIIDGALAFSPDGSIGLTVIPDVLEDRGWQFWVVPMPDGNPYQRLTTWNEPAPRISNFTWLSANRIVLGVKSLRSSGTQLWMADLDRDRAWPLTQGTDVASYPSASPKGDRVIFGRGEANYDVVEITLATGVVTRLLDTERNESDPVYLRDDQFAYVTDRRGADEIWKHSRTGPVTDVRLVDQTDFGDDQTLMLSAPIFSADGEWLAFQRNGYHPRQPLRIWWRSATTDGPSTPLPRAGAAVQGEPTWSPDGRSIAYPEWRDHQWALMKARVGSGDAPQVLRTDGVSNSAPRWSRNGWITWETGAGMILVSSDGNTERPLGSSAQDDAWLAHAWTSDGLAVVAIRQTKDRRLSLVLLPIDGKPTRTICDLGPAPLVNNPVKGLSLSADGRRALTSIAKLQGDLWMMTGLAATIKIP